MSQLHRWLYGPELGWQDTPTPPRPGERVEFRGSVIDWARQQYAKTMGSRTLALSFERMMQEVEATQVFLRSDCAAFLPMECML